MSTEHILGVSCPDCLARKGAPCVYLPVATVSYSPAGLDRQLRVGQPTKRPHNARYNKANLKARVAKKKAWEARMSGENALAPDRQSILEANAQAVLDEQRQLIAWLEKHASILTMTERTTTGRKQ